MNNTKRNRLDIELVNRGLVSSREKAQALIMAGEVFIKDRVELKASFKVTQAELIILKKRYPYVSRGAFKIQTALDEFDINPKGLKVVDIGISNGGFSDFILKNGAECILGIDVNIRQVDVSLRENSRVILLKKNARYLIPEDFKFYPDIIVIDLSFISVLKVLPCLTFLKNTKILALIKPQFEAERGEVKKGGIIRNPILRDKILNRVKSKIEKLGMRVLKTTPAGIKGRKGNLEYFFLIAIAQ